MLRVLLNYLCVSADYRNAELYWKKQTWLPVTNKLDVFKFLGTSMLIDINLNISTA